ncbi:2'-5' RNA ligase family protein [Neorhizobium sp. JUb45]|uniref:2'-5' RNA ligase family protein n=1 Tax=unclassified Neorhizobium TaxID=2629175 RepID=UPI001051BF80|nr:2'-5' RNA ligase family protein [Neorhizobium sp. JUb45]TCR00536.1 2'-5' RNA ligase superfamily protein [Neorhizobium sp. JUb45]
MKTRQPLILTARIAKKDLEPFERLRKTHFPPDRNFLHAHLTMFHRLPGEYRARIEEQLHLNAQATEVIAADVSGLRHLGAGVAFSITSPALLEIRAELKAGFLSWLGPQDMQPWRPHITVQNKSSKAEADELYRTLDQKHQPHLINITGLDLWEYLGGPWRHTANSPFSTSA